MAIPMLVMAGLTAAMAAAQGIAGAAQTEEAAKVAASEQNKSRYLQEQMQKRQLAEQQRQHAAGLQMGAESKLQGALQDGAALQTNRAAERAATREGMRSTLTRAMLGR
jgi:hypothetical protein